MAVRNVHSTDLSPEATEARSGIARVYLEQATAAFLEGYRMAAAALPHAWQDRDGEGAALTLLGIEKAAYEIRYEAQYRPDWLAVPLQGLARLVKPLLESSTDDQP